jgi:E-phenylitaconyl-CoA hydratase
MSIDLEVSDAVATIVINRPERHNAMDPEHYAALSEAWIRVRDDNAIRCAIITGAGEKSFSSGADLKTHIGREFQLHELWLTQNGQLLNRGLEVWKPVIAAVNGFCLGGGMTLLLAADIRIAAEHASFGVTEVRRGVIPANGGTQRLLAQLPHPIAMDMLLRGRTMSAVEAERWGLVNEVVPQAKLLETAMNYAREIAANAPLAVQAAKELAIRSRDMDLASGLRMEQLVNRILQGTQDVVEGRAAFTEKRAPRFKGL